MRATLIRRAVILAVVVLLASLAITAFTGGLDSIEGLGWPLALTGGVALFSAWQSFRGVRQSMANGIPRDFRLVPVDPAQWPKADWAAIEDLSIQLEARGYSRLGDYTSNASQAMVRGFARFLADREGTRIVEIQHFEKVALPAGAMPDDQFGLHFNVTSVLGGRIRVQAAERQALPVFFMIRGDHVVAATFPGLGLLEVIEKHRRLVAHVAERTGRTPAPGFTLERYVKLEREKFAQARRRIEGVSGWALAGEWDAFNAAPRTRWSPPEKELAALQVRGWDAVDALDASPPTGEADPEAPAEDPRLLERVRGGASWFYWIAGLSLVNAIAAAFGSSWGFIIGLGVTQVLDAIATSFGESGEVGIGFAVRAAAFAVIAAFAWLGRAASRPSARAFALGILLFALDTLIFLVAADWIGLAFHALALYFLGTGYSAARALLRVRAAA